MANKQTSTESELPLEEQVAVVLKAMSAGHYFAQQHVVMVVGSAMDKSDWEAAIAGTYYRMHLWFEALVNLPDPRHFQVYNAGSRSIFELLLDLKMLSSSPSLAERFHDFVKVERFNAARKVVNYLDANPSLDRSKYQADVALYKNKVEAESLCREHWGTDKKGKLLWPTHWSGKNVADRAKDIGIEYEEIYRRDYPWNSWYVHAGSVGTSGLSHDSFIRTFALAGLRAQQMFLEATEIVAKAFRLGEATLGFEKELQSLKSAVGVFALVVSREHSIAPNRKTSGSEESKEST